MINTSGSGVPTPQEPEITEEMIEAAAEQIYGGPSHRFKLVDGSPVEYTVAWHEVTEKLGEDERDVYLRKARRILTAALAGRAVVELPEPTHVADASSNRHATWDTGNDFTASAVGGSFGARVNIRGGPYLTASAAEGQAAALLAAAREARRLSGSRKDGNSQT